MADTIYRQEAIDELRLRFDDTAESWMEMRDLVIDTIKDLPSAQPERMKGQWVEDVAYYDEEGCPCIVTRCDQCGEPGTGNYCSYCGADMRGD